MVLQHDRNVVPPEGTLGRSPTYSYTHHTSQHQQHKQKVASSHIHSNTLLHQPHIHNQPHNTNPPQHKHSVTITPYENKVNHMSSRDRRRKHGSRTFGDSLLEKEDSTIRIVSQNINCIGVSTHNNPKQEQIKSWLIENAVDIIGWQETGVSFHMVSKNRRLPERMKDPRWTKQRTSSYNNTHERVSRFQYGGTAVMTVDEAAHRVKTTGGDPTGLGRWSWILFEGKHKHLVRVISAYVPCKTAGTHRKTVYAQHERYFHR